MRSSSSSSLTSHSSVEAPHPDRFGQSGDATRPVDAPDPVGPLRRPAPDLARARLAEPVLEADRPEVWMVAGHQRAVVETGAEIARLGIPHDLPRVFACLQVAR